MTLARAILHVDMDAFYASIEQRDNPALRGKPVLVAGPSHVRGVVSAASYEARAFGCHSAQPTSIALRRCPQAVVVPVRMAEYVRVSRQIAEIFRKFTPVVEPLSIDEAFLDVTGSRRLFGAAREIARQIKDEIFTVTGLHASVGVAPNKFVAKLASDHEKPDGLVEVSADGVQAFLDPLPIGRLWGAGRATLPKFETLRIRTFGDARRLTEDEFVQHFGKTTGPHFWRLVRGIDDRAVHTDRDAKSISHEQTFGEDVADVEALRGILLDQVDQVARRLRAHGRAARTVNLKIRRGDFHTISRS
ncbi:MAG: DNA polymerase IV, partial [Phycisphaerae bacterium]